MSLPGFGWERRGRVGQKDCTSKGSLEAARYRRREQMQSTEGDPPKNEGELQDKACEILGLFTFHPASSRTTSRSRIVAMPEVPLRRRPYVAVERVPGTTPRRAAFRERSGSSSERGARAYGISP